MIYIPQSVSNMQEFQGIRYLLRCVQCSEVSPTLNSCSYWAFSAFFFFSMPGSVLGLESLHWSLRNLLCHLTYNHANMLNWHPWLIPWSVSNRLEFQGITYLLHCVSLKRSLPILNWSKFRQHYENQGHPVRFSQSCGQTSLLFLWQNQPRIHSS